MSHIDSQYRLFNPFLSENNLEYITYNISPSDDEGEETILNQQLINPSQSSQYYHKDESSNKLQTSTSNFSTLFSSTEYQKLLQKKQRNNKENNSFFSDSNLDTLSSTTENYIQNSENNLIQKQKNHQFQQQSVNSQLQSQNSLENSQSQNFPQNQQNNQNSLQENQLNCNYILKNFFNNPPNLIQKQINQQQDKQQINDSDFPLNNGKKNDSIKNQSPTTYDENKDLEFEQHYLFDHFQYKDSPIESITNMNSCDQSIICNPTQQISNNYSFTGIQTNNNNDQDQQEDEEKSMEIVFNSDNEEEEDYIQQQKQNKYNQDQNNNFDLTVSLCKPTQQPQIKKRRRQRRSKNPQLQKTEKIKYGEMGKEIYDMCQINIYEDYINELQKGFPLQHSFSHYNLKQGVNQLQSPLLQGQVFRYINHTNIYKTKDLKNKKYTHFKQNKNYVLIVQQCPDYPNRPFLVLVKKQ